MKKLLPLLLLFMIGCNSLERKHYKAVKFFNENENLAAEYCSGKFPSETKYIKGDPIIKIDTVPKLVPYKVDCDSLVNANKGTNKPNVFNGTKKVPCEQKTITVTDTIVKSNTAYETVLRNKINVCNADVIILEKELKESTRLNWILGGILLISIILIFIKR